jgi:hypothetical protein
LLVALAPHPRRLLRAALAILGVVAIVAPWRIFLAVHDLTDLPAGSASAFDFGYLSAHTDRVEPSARALWEQATRAEWGYLLPLLVAGVVASALARRFALTAFALVWAGLSFLGLVLVYWSSAEPLDEYLRFSADRVVVSFVIGAAALAPLLAGEAWRLVLARHPAPTEAETVAERRRPAAAGLLERT